jgi:hypothetical protein
MTADRLRVGVLGGVRLDDADLLYFTLSRWVAVSFTPEPKPEITADPVGVQRLNHMMWRNANRFLALHPDEDWRRALALGPRRGVPLRTPR